MSVEAMAAAFKTKFNNPSARLVLFSLADHHNRSTGLCYPKVKTIMDDACLSRATVFRSLEWLEGLPDPNNPKKTFSPVKIIKRTPIFDKNGRQTSSKFELLFLAPTVSNCDGGGSQIETGEGLTCETGEGLNHETPLKITGRSNRKNEQTPLPPKGETGAVKAEAKSEEIELKLEPTDTPSRKRQRLPLVELHDDWALPDEWLQAGLKAHPKAQRRDIEYQAALFRNHAHGSGRRQQRWKAAFAGWLLKAQKLPGGITAPKDWGNSETAPKGNDHETRLMVAKSYFDSGYWSKGCSSFWNFPKELLAWAVSHAPQIVPTSQLAAAA